MLLEVEGENHHLGRAAVHTAGELEHPLVGEVRAVVVDDVTQSEAKLEFGNEFEVREVEVTTGTDFYVTIKGLSEQGIVLAHGEVKCRCHTGDDIRTEIVVARCCNLKPNRHGEASGFHALCAVASRDLLMKEHTSLSEVDGGLDAQAKGAVEAYLTQHTHSEAWLVAIDVGVPLLSAGWVHIAVILELYIHHIHADEEAIVEEAAIQIGAVLNDGFLCCKGDCYHPQTQQQEPQRQ